MLFLPFWSKTFTSLQFSVSLSYPRRFYPPRQHITETILHSKLLVPKPSMHQLALFKIPATSTILCSRVQYNIPLKPKFNNNIISTNKFIQNKSLDSAILSLINKPQSNIAKPFLDKPRILRTFNNKEYETFLTENTTINDITEEQLIHEMKKREIVNQDTGKTTVVIKLEDTSDHMLGLSKNDVKLTQVGQAYVENFILNTRINEKNNNEMPKFSAPISRGNLKIIIPPKSESDSFVETGKQKHLLVIVDENTRIFPIGYLTSKSSAEFLSTQQFKAFQNQKETLDITITKKKQHYVEFTQLMEIYQDDVKRVKWDKDYIENLSEESFKNLVVSFEKMLKQERCEFYDNKGLTKEDCLKMCIEHDKIADKKGAKHPLSADQIKQNVLNSEKMKVKGQEY